MRIQGTDGIRRPTALDSSSRVQGLKPLGVFLKAGLITPQFMELYAYSFIVDLLRLQRIAPSEPVVVGWDPRDPNGDFIEAFIRGVRKAGATVFSVGVVPTPAVPAYLLNIGAAAGAMITASHNLKDQNGVKLFWAHGLKYLPSDDERLTAVILELADSIDLKCLDPTGGLEDHHDAASSLFERFMLHPVNSWLAPTEDAAARLRFERIELVVDTANGCLSKFAGKLFRKWGFGSVHEVNTSEAGDVNEGGGVAALEGTEIIARDDVFARGGSGSSPFSDHRAVLEMFRLADELKDDLLDGSRMLVAAVFDADGDRFFRLDYAPHQDSLIVSSGDEAGFLQAKYLVERQPVSGHPRMVHTVESDINVGAFAEKSLGVSPVMTAVGDKWVLYEAFASLLEGRMALLEARFVGKGHEEAARELELARKSLETLRSPRSNDSQRYFDLQWQVDSIERKHCSPDQIATMEEDLLKPGAIPYLIGFEETGHSIAPAILPVAGITSAMRRMATGPLTPDLGSSTAENFGQAGKPALHREVPTAGQAGKPALRREPPTVGQAGKPALHRGPPTAGQAGKPALHRGLPIRGAASQLPTTNRLFFAGNGLKAAINTFVATQTILQPRDLSVFHEVMTAPFMRGFKRTFYAYYTRKEEFASGKRYWQQFAGWLEQECLACFASGFDVKRVDFAEERDMIFVSLAKKGGSRTIASVFVRNSGTEEKTSVNVRGPKELAELLDDVGDRARRRLLMSLKSSESDYAAAEAALLKEMKEHEARGDVLTVSDATQLLADKHPSVVPERLLLEMFRQDFIAIESLTEGNAPFHLTPLGTWYVGQ